MEAVYKVCGTSLWASLARAAVKPSASCWVERSYNIQRAEVELGVKNNGTCSMQHCSHCLGFSCCIFSFLDVLLCFFSHSFFSIKIRCSTLSFSSLVVNQSSTVSSTSSIMHLGFWGTAWEHVSVRWKPLSLGFCWGKAYMSLCMHMQRNIIAGQWITYIQQLLLILWGLRLKIKNPIYHHFLISLINNLYHN